ncbi:MAG: GTPase domain-containing protein [Verrucomicrobiales bacterium]|nr:GTPase domain-containing protein [Verrucomicrobiales bacterium]
MAVVNHDTREVQFKIVYCGTPLGGKTTNLIYIHQRLAPNLRGALASIATEQERTLFFDFLPVHPTIIAGYDTRFQLYSVPGQRIYSETRRIVLTGVDGIVFVADSDPARHEANLEALECTIADLRVLNRSFERMPVVFQFNKRDLSNAMAPEEMDEALGVTRPTYLACAGTGYNVFATLDAVTQKVLRDFHLRRRMRAAALAAGQPAPQPAGARQTSLTVNAAIDSRARAEPQPGEVALGS